MPDVGWPHTERAGRVIDGLTQSNAGERFAVDDWSMPYGMPCSLSLFCPGYCEQQGDQDYADAERAHHHRATISRRHRLTIYRE